MAPGELNSRGSSEMQLAGKKVIVLAGVTGTGRATALVTAREGASVVLMSLEPASHERATTTLEACRAAGPGRFHYVQCDASDRAIVDRAVAEAVDFLGGLDAIVLGQGTDHLGPSATLGIEAFQADMGNAFYGTVNCAQAAYPHLEDKGGTIITFGGLSFTRGNEHYAAYNASKGAIIGFSRTIAREWAPDRIRVNTVGPVVMTEISEEFLKVATPEQLRSANESLKEILLGPAEVQGFDRMGDASEVGELIAFLVSDKATYITGQYINVDGGAAMGRV